ncbi:hypothetical protein K370107A2_15780 [Merdimmobilis hominis]|uniref:hypothetical protein n=1 Tax=Merdimmobilis hominis TaxID=2897707 RepID=UPI0032D377FD
MGIFDGYKREERPRLEPGDHRVEIVSAEETVSKSGNPMLVVGLRPAGSDIRILHYLVKNEYFNRNLTELYDSFGIEEGDNNLLGWIGAAGGARLREDEQGYLRVQYLLSPQKQEKLPPWPGDKPQRQAVNTAFTELPDDDDLPF